METNGTGYQATEHRTDIALALLATASIAGIVWIGRAA
jgi:hypothetical protein